MYVPCRELLSVLFCWFTESRTRSRQKHQKGKVVAPSKGEHIFLYGLALLGVAKTLTLRENAFLLGAWSNTCSVLPDF